MMYLLDLTIIRRLYNKVVLYGNTDSDGPLKIFSLGRTHDYIVFILTTLIKNIIMNDISDVEFRSDRSNTNFRLKIWKVHLTN